MEEEVFNKLTEGLPSIYWERLNEAVSMEHATVIADQLRGVARANETLSEAGWPGFTARIGAAILDPVAVAVGLATGGIGAIATKAERTREIFRIGLISGVTEAGIEAVVGDIDPTRGADDILYAGLGGFILGTSAAVFFTRRLKGAEVQRRHMERADAEDAIGSHGEGAAISEKGETYFDDPQAAGRKWIDDAAEAQGLDPDDAAEFTSLQESGALNTVHSRVQGKPREGESADLQQPSTVREDLTEAERPTTEPLEGIDVEDLEVEIEPKRAGDFVLNFLTAAKAKFAAVRWSMAGRIGANPSPLTRMTGSAMMQDALNKSDNKPQELAATEWVTIYFSAMMGRFHRVAQPAFSRWAKEQGFAANLSIKRKDQFFEEVGKAVRRNAGDYTSDVNINRVADLHRTMETEVALMAKRHGVKGFEFVTPSETFLPRLYSVPRIQKLINEFGEEAVENMMATALLRGSRDLTPKFAPRVAKAMLRVIMNTEEFTDLQRSRLISMQDIPFLARVLRSEISDITEDQISDIINAVRPRQREAGILTARARRRASLDETYTTQLTNKAGQTRSIGIEDMIENNAAELMEIYVKQVSGAAAMTEVFRVISRETGVEVNTWEKLSSLLREDMVKNKVKKGKINKDLERLDVVRKAIMGQRIGNDTPFAGWLRSFRLMNHLRISGQFGFAQVPEFGIAVGSSGFTAMLQQMPTLARIFSKAKNGELSDSLLEELQTIWGLGTSRSVDQVTARFDQGEALVEFGGGNLERTLRRGARLANDLSLMAPIHIMQKLMVGSLAAQKFANIAWSGRSLSKKRLASLGLTPELAERISGQIRTHGAFEPALIGKKIVKTNVNVWKDLEAASAFITAMDRWSTKTIQQVDIGNMALWMTEDMGRMIMQYRSFTVVAWEKQFLHRLDMHDWQAFVEMTSAMMFAAVGYSVQQTLLAQGREDKKEFLAKKLTTEEIIKTAFLRAGWSTFAPEAIDQINRLAGGTTIFNERNSQLKVDTWLGNPTFDMFNSAAAAMTSALQPWRDEEDTWTQADARRAANLIFFRRSFGISNVIDAMITRLPED